MANRSISLFDLHPGKLVHERYKIVRGSRAAGMSTAFEVTDGENGPTREMQVFPADLFESKKQSLEFTAAMTSWKLVRAPSTIAVREVHALEDGTVLLVTDPAVGRSLRAWQQEHGRAKPSQVVALGLEMLDGLSAIHAAGLVHGDIKPLTVYVGDGAEPTVTLIDGGITPALWSSKHLGEKTALIGTPFYAPIEQFGGDSPDVQSDVYNLATVLFELVTGVLPWKGKSFLEVFQAKLDKTVPSMKSRAPDVEVPPALEAAIAGGLRAEEKDRYGSAVEFRAKLTALRA